jgi:GT2 family glycosyltransferase
LVIASIRRLGAGFGFCVIENGGDNSFQKLEAFQRQTNIDFQVHRVPNRGFGAACNAAARLYPGKNILYLNPDCAISAEDSIRLFDCLDSAPGNVVAPLVYDHLTGAVQNLRNSWTSKWTVIPMWLNLGRFRSQRSAPVTVAPVQPLWIAGSAFTINADVLLKHGAFDENFFLYFEEEDFFRRMALAGGKCIVETGAHAIHEAGTSTTERRSNIREFMLLSGLYYVHKWHGKKVWNTVSFACKALLKTGIGDIFMPSLNRRALLERIHASENGSQLKIEV